jgi:hypothetical protein
MIAEIKEKYSLVVDLDIGQVQISAIQATVASLRTAAKGEIRQKPYVS